jgi:DNA-binding NarL/FixJ family response regulator
VIKDVIAEDMDIVRESLKYMIESDMEMEVVGLAANGREDFEMCGIHKPEIVIMDIKMPECDGLEGTRLIKSKYPDIKVLILTTFEDALINSLRTAGRLAKLLSHAHINILKGAGHVLINMQDKVISFLLSKE